MLLALLTLFAGGLALWMSRRVSSEISDKADWPTVPGKILERGVGDAMETEHRSYLPRAVYTYEVAGKPFKNDQVYLIRKTGGVDALPDPVPVHYDPADPQSSYLVVNPTGTSTLLLIFSIGAFVLGALQLLVLVTKSN